MNLGTGRETQCGRRMGGGRKAVGGELQSWAPWRELLQNKKEISAWEPPWVLETGRRGLSRRRWGSRVKS